MLAILAKLLKALNSEASPTQIAVAVALAFIVALTPLWSWHNALILFIALVTRINLTTFLVATGVFSLIAIVIDPLSATLGEYLLAHPELQSFWTELYQNEFWRISGFNHTLVLGGLTISLAAFIPLLFISKFLVVQYRDKLLEWVDKLWITKIIKGSKFYSLYMKFAG